MPSSPPHLRTRQVHLDFHTSALIPSVGEKFDAEAYAERLDEARVNSVTTFGRCHHGMLYYPSKWRPDLVHPNLKVPNLLNQQIEACHKRDIRVPVYTTIQWDEYAMKKHPEWLTIGADGLMPGNLPLEAGFYRFLDVSHAGYRQYLQEHLADLLAQVPELDGLFLDIVHPRESVAPHRLEMMLERGMNPDSEEDRKQNAEDVMHEWQVETSEFLRSLPQWRDDMTIFYNPGHVGPRLLRSDEAFTHYEVESLPSGAWGYLHFPLSASYARTMGKPTLGMTGKFHTAWGDFHSYKTPEALEYEGLRTLSFGSAISVGDQLPPDGELDQLTYENMGKMFKKAEAIEPWCVPSIPVKEVGILTPEAFEKKMGQAAQAEKQHDADSGAVRMMLELRRCFDRIDESADFSSYRVLILPDRVPVEGELKTRLEAYVADGGSLIISHQCGEAASLAGVTFDGYAEHEPDFLRVKGGLAGALPDTPHTMYQRATKITAIDSEAEVWAESEAPFFTRSWRHFCSHRHAPSSGEVMQPTVVAKGRCVYFAHPIFEMYHHLGPRWLRQIMGAALDRLTAPIVADSGPVGMSTSLLDQPEQSRYALHVLYYPAERKASGTDSDTGGAAPGGFDVIEDIVPLHDLKISLRLPKPAKHAVLQPQGTPVELTDADGAQSLTLPKLEGHQAIELAY